MRLTSEKKLGFTMTGRAPLREANNMYGGTSINRNYQSTGRTLSNREGNLELYAHRKNQSKNELSYPNGDKNERRGWKKDPKDKMGLQRYNSIEMQRDHFLENSLPPKEKYKRGLSILNRENNNFVRDVSERVKREPLTRLKSIGLYQDKDNEYQFSEEYLQKKEKQARKDEVSKSGVLKEDKKQVETFKSIRVLNKSLKQEKPNDKRTSIDRDTLGESKKKKLKSETLKHLKRRNPRKKKRDMSTRKKADKEPRKKDKTKKKSHQPSLSIKLDRHTEASRSKRPADGPEKKPKKKKRAKATESISKVSKKKKKELKAGKSSDESKKLFVSGEVFMNSIYLDKEAPEKRKKRGKKTKTKAREGKKAKGLKLAKKSKDSPVDMTSNERKRYLSVNTGKNPLLESDLVHHFNPRKTLNPKSIGLKRGNSFKSNDIQKTELFTYKFKRDSLKNELKPVHKSKSKGRKKDMLYSNQEPKTPQAALYQRNRSQASSDNDDQAGLYKNLYSGRHEKKILNYNSNQSEDGTS